MTDEEEAPEDNRAKETVAITDDELRQVLEHLHKLLIEAAIRKSETIDFPAHGVVEGLHFSKIGDVQVRLTEGGLQEVSREADTEPAPPPEPSEVIHDVPTPPEAPTGHEDPNEQ